MLPDRRSEGGHTAHHAKLDALDEGDNLVSPPISAALRQVIDGWRAYGDTRKLLSGQFPTFPIFG